MVFERTEHEPEEDDPESDFHDPDADSLTIPRVEPPTVDSPEGSDAHLADVDVPADLAKTFWTVVVGFNAALLAVSVGAMLAVFRGDLTTGAGLVVGGLVLFGLAYRRYRTFRRSNDEPDDASRDEEREGGSTTGRSPGVDP